MNKFNVVVREDEVSLAIALDIKEKLIKGGLVYDEVDPNLVISVGGDGTMLNSIHQYIKKLKSISFCGVRTGNLGFYTDFKPEEVDFLIEQIINDDYYVINHNLLEICIITNEKKYIHYALNEGRIENNIKTQVLDVYINEEHFETIRGNGLNFSTPSGSTGYNKSLKGAVIHPRVKAFQMCEIASINNTIFRSLGSPLILDKTHYVDVKFRDLNEAILGYDSYLIDLDEFENLKALRFSLSKKYVKFARFKRYNFMERVRKSFID